MQVDGEKDVEHIRLLLLLYHFTLFNSSIDRCESEKTEREEKLKSQNERRDQNQVFKDTRGNEC